MPSNFGAFSFFSQVTALCTALGVSLLLSAFMPQRPVGVPVTAPELLVVSAYMTLVPVTSSFRVRVSSVSPMAAPISSEAAIAMGSTACRSSRSEIEV